MPYMRRKIEQAIEAWWAAGGRRPLLIRGARRTGKTRTVEEVGRRLAGDGFVKIDFQANLELAGRIFSGATDDLDGIIANIRDLTGRDLRRDESLIFLDEVQLNEKALNSLRFFSESGWRIIATGSLLGVTTKRRRLPFPSGVKQIDMHPMDFEEFLWALGQDAMARAIREHAQSCAPYILHEAALSTYRTYLVVGGMPRAVLAYVEEGSLVRVAAEHREIDETYTADMTNPENGISGVSALRIWRSLPAQLMRSSTKKFKYSDVVRGGRRQRLLEPLEWLAAAGIVTIHDMTRETQAPLVPYSADEGSFFKVYIADTGLMFDKFGVDASLFLAGEIIPLSSDFRGALAENFVMQSLAAQDLRTYYWTPPESWKAKGELDFVTQTKRAEIVPLEVKSGRNVAARTLRRFAQEGGSPFAIRLSAEQFGKSLAPDSQTELRSLPLYAAFAVSDLLG